MDSRILAFFLMLVVIVSARSSAQTVEMDGQPRTAADLAALRQEIAKDLERIPTLTGTDEEKAALKKALEEQASALESLGKLLTRLAGAAAREGEEKEKAEEIQKRITEARIALENPSIEEPVTAERLTGIEASQTAAAAAAKVAEGTVKTLEAAVPEREAAFADAAKRVADLTVERDALKGEAPSEGAPEISVLAHRARTLTLEARLREIDLAREKHAELLSLDKAAAGRARAELELAKAENSLAARTLEIARTKREASLEAQQKAAAADAERKRKLAELYENEPAARAVVRLEALVAEHKGKALGDSQDLSSVQRSFSRAESLAGEAQKRNEVLKRRLESAGVGDEARRVYMVEQADRLQRRRRAFESWGLDEKARLPRVRRRALKDRDALVDLRERVSEDTGSDHIEAGQREAAVDEAPEGVLSRWIEARNDFHKGREALSKATSKEEAERIISKWGESLSALNELLNSRIDALTQIDDIAGKAVENLEKITELYERRRVDINDALLWLPHPPLFDADEFAHVTEEVGLLLSAPPSQALRQQDERVRLETWGVVAILFAIPGCLLLRSKKSEEGARKPRGIVRRAARSSGPVLLLAGAGCFVAGWLAPNNAFAIAGSAALLILGLLMFGVRVTRGLLGLADEEGASRPGRWIAMSLTLVGLLLALAVYAEVVGFGHVASLSRIATHALAAVVLSVLAWRVPKAVETACAEEDHSGWLFWLRVGLVTAAIGALGALILEIEGYRVAGVFLGARGLLALALVVLAVVVFVFVRGLIDRRIASKPVSASVPRAEAELIQRRQQLARRVFVALVFLAVSIATLLALSFVARVGLHRWADWSGWVLIQGVGGEADLTIAGLLLALTWFGATFFIAGVLREWIQVGQSRRFLTTGARFAVGTLAFYAIVGFGFITGFRLLGISLGALGWLLAPAGVAIGFGLTELLSNFVSGFILFLERPVQVGDIITVGDVQGDVTRISIRATVVRTRDGVSIIIPNKELIVNQVINWSHGRIETRLHVGVGVAYGSDVKLVKKILLDVARADQRVMSYPVPEVDFTAFGESELQFDLLIWLRSPDLTLRRNVRSELNFAIDQAFRTHGVEIPFPQRDLHIRSTPKDHRPAALAAEEEEEDGAGS